jgi:lipopolysaccharide transport system permease protein
MGQLVGDLLANLGFAVVIAQRSINSRYKQTFLGFGWALIQPLATLLIFTIFFGHLAKIDAGGGTYAAFALSAVVPWQFFAALVTEGASALALEANLVRRVALSRLALVVGKAGSSLVPYGVGLGLMAVLGPFIGANLGVNLLWIPLLSLLVALPALALGCVLAAVGVWTRDVNFGLPFVMQALMFASPVAFPVAGLGSGWQRLYALGNPVVGPLEGMRRAYALNQAPAFDLLVLSALTSLALTLAALEVFRRLEPGFADVI